MIILKAMMIKTYKEKEGDIFNSEEEEKHVCSEDCGITLFRKHKIDKECGKELKKE